MIKYISYTNFTISYKMKVFVKVDMFPFFTFAVEKGNMFNQ